MEVITGGALASAFVVIVSWERRSVGPQRCLSFLLEVQQGPVTLPARCVFRTSASASASASLHHFPSALFCMHVVLDHTGSQALWKQKYGSVALTEVLGAYSIAACMPSPEAGTVNFPGVSCFPHFPFFFFFFKYYSFFLVIARKHSLVLYACIHPSMQPLIHVSNSSMHPSIHAHLHLTSTCRAFI